MAADVIINGREYEVKANDYPETIACECCGEPMEFISIEEGYSCSNPNCVLHMAAK